MITEIEVEDVGTLRPCNDWQIARIKRIGNRQIAWVAFGLGMTIRQFKGLPALKQQECWRAHYVLTHPANMPQVRGRAFSAAAINRQWVKLSEFEPSRQWNERQGAQVAPLISSASASEVALV